MKMNGLFYAHFYASNKIQHEEQRKINFLFRNKVPQILN